jgi:hypothetical protein
MPDYRDHPTIREFKKSFTALDEYLVSPYYTDIYSMKIRMLRLVEDTVRKIQYLPPTSYEIYLPLFESINHSKLLAYHRYPRLSLFGPRHTATKQKLLEMIRRAAMESLREESSIEHHEAVSRSTHKKICKRIAKAKVLPLFAMHRHNWPALFEPPLTASYKELNAIEQRLLRSLAEEEEMFTTEKIIREHYSRSSLQELKL